MTWDIEDKQQFKLNTFIADNNVEQFMNPTISMSHFLTNWCSITNSRVNSQWVIHVDYTGIELQCFTPYFSGHCFCLIFKFPVNYAKSNYCCQVDVQVQRICINILWNFLEHKNSYMKKLPIHLLASIEIVKI